jgi:fucose 4-O-acetylase-like acetyltransferase
MYIQQSKKANRIEWIDLAKGVTILLVVVGHCFGFSGQPMPLRLIRGFIFSFHMPLFFALSMTTYRLSDSNDMIIRKSEKAFKHLIIPACVLFTIQTLLFILTKWDGESKTTFIIKTINTFVYSSGCPVTIGKEIIPGIGMIWFFTALFLGRIIFDYLQLKLNKKPFIFVICLLSIVGVIISRLQHLPLSFDVVLAILPFLAFGNVLKHINLRKHLLIYSIISFCIWLITFGMEFLIKNSYLELALRNYPLYPLCYVTAVSGILFVSCISVACLKMHKMMIPLIYIGKNSMYFFWAHIMDYVFQPIWSISSHPLIIVGLRLIIDTVLFFLIICSIKLVIFFIEKIKNKERFE